MDSGTGGGRDSISMLPDEFICHILSLLPTKYVVGTSVLSSRWQDLWAYVPNLDFDDSLYFDNSKTRGPTRVEMDSSFMNFVDKVIHLSNVSCFQSFRLKLKSINDFFRVNTWICVVLKRNVQNMELHYLNDSPISLPSKLFESKTLVILILKRAILVEVPTSVWLPKLKTLHLDRIVKYKDEGSAQKLFSGCPILEELYIERWQFDTRRALEISVPTLKRLRLRGMIDDEFSDDDDVGSEVPFKLVINAPKLEHLDIEDFVSEEILVNLSSLLEARIDVGGCIIMKLMSEIRTVKSLSLSDSTLSYYYDVKSYLLPTFHNLIILELGANGDFGWNLLAEILGCSPNLEVLILRKGPSIFSLFESEQCWNSPQEVPNCLLLHLKKIEIEEFNGNEHELEGIEYLLENAMVLKTMTINCQSPNINKEEVRNILTGFPRGSKISQLDICF